MDVLVTGASGFIGSALVSALEGDGHRVGRLTRSDNAGPDTLRWDPAAGRIDAAGLEGFGAVVHLAGAGIGDKRWTSDRKRVIRDSRTQGTLLLAGALAGLRTKPAVLVSASAVGYYGPRDEEELTEDSRPGDDFLAGVCVAWEQSAAPAAEAGIRVVTIRSGVVLSPGGGVLERMVLPFKLGLGGRLGTGKQYMSWISLDDEVGAILHLLGHDGVSGPVNLTAPNPVTNSEYTKTLGAVVGRPTAIPTPITPLKLRYGSELVHFLLLTGQRVLPNRLEASGYQFGHDRLEPALRELLGKPAA
ncbi:MAG TPA: TIGR01777 family oxidoreductase [Acidimicrobiia bacterium]|nr:TIGR01777 family oxidoreductase [Acidimicrobiia bacterium]